MTDGNPNERIQRVVAELDLDEPVSAAFYASMNPEGDVRSGMYVDRANLPEGVGAGEPVITLAYAHLRELAVDHEMDFEAVLDAMGEFHELAEDHGYELHQEDDSTQD